MNILEYPFDSGYILKKRKHIKQALKEQISASNRLHKKIAILGGSTTHDIKDILELFLLNYGIEPEFYESDYNQYWQDIMFDNANLIQFSPDIIFIHTTTRNIATFPGISNTEDDIEKLLQQTYSPYVQMWDKIFQQYKCPIIQNNFEQPYYRILGNRDVSDKHGRLNFINRLNNMFYEYSQSHEHFYINDINYIASCYGIQRWADPFYWHMYKMAMALSAIPEFAFNLANIIKSIYGKNKKAFVLDLDNTLWGGVIGDDGPDKIEIGQETSLGQLYSEFQSYIKALKDIGVLLTIDSKNDECTALSGLNRPDTILKPNDFTVIKANWLPKNKNVLDIANELNIGVDSLVFVDDNPAERFIIQQQITTVAVPDIGTPEQYIERIDRNGYFEVTNISADDLKRNEMYQTNIERQKQIGKYTSYEDYLRSLEMVAEIGSFSSTYMSRIAQLTNKSNQFNLTTKRCSLADIEAFARNPEYITLYGKLSDRFGDNGVVSVVWGHIDTKYNTIFHIDCWLMSCRVLKRGMESAMMDSLFHKCLKKGIKEIYGYYYPTPKNKMVENFYSEFDYQLVSKDTAGATTWKYKLKNNQENLNKIILVEEI